LTGPQDTTGPLIQGVTTEYGTRATAGQYDLLHQVSPASGSFYDVTQLDITFTAGPSTSHVIFNAVFGSAEYPVYVGQYSDGFGLFLNGKHIAYAGGQPVNVDSSLMVNGEHWLPDRWRSGWLKLPDNAPGRPPGIERESCRDV